jgi:rhamnosyl/mannosyltransferase
VNYIVAASPNYLASSDILNRYQYKTKVITYGLNKDSYAEPTIESLKQWRKITGEKFFLFLGVLRYYKGLHILLDALVGVDYPVVIAGSGPIESELIEHAKQLNLKNIHFVGKVSEEDKVALLFSSYSIVFPSHLCSEAFGISLLEGAMYGKPMISREIGTGTTYINTDNKTGVVVPPNEPMALREALTHLWDNEEEAKKMGKNAEERYWELFTADKMVESYADLYRELKNE